PRLFRALPVPGHQPPLSGRSVVRSSAVQESAAPGASSNQRHSIRHGATKDTENLCHGGAEDTEKRLVPPNGPCQAAPGGAGSPPQPAAARPCPSSPCSLTSPLTVRARTSDVLRVLRISEAKILRGDQASTTAPMYRPTTSGRLLPSSGVIKASVPG